ncbi:hypothetical protein [Photobacterium kishitanii]|uniref:hypothetical protein n=1 Tax=Photobacterium kishitanii TaxID=318456 RepID=UPI000D152CC3|nr:hypothetical protein [Photobacterium kishitanii]PSV22950.1 hypothetical protein C0W28_05855 [Photobacterium kishitanii]
MSKLQTGLALCFSGLFFIISLLFIHPAEDAVILYEYSNTLANTGVISYGNIGTPIEGATDFLWMVAISLFHLVGINEYTASLMISSLSLYLLIKLLCKHNHLFFILIAMTITSFIYSAAFGFSSIVFSTIYLYCLQFYLQKKYKNMHLCILLLCLFRPDGVVWGASLVLLYQFENRFSLSKERLLVSLKYLIIPGGFYFLWRMYYFNELLPLPFYIKQHGIKELLLFSYSSLKDVAIVAIPMLIVISMSKNKATIILITIIPILFYSSMTLSQNIGNRFIAPLFFGVLYLLNKEGNIKKYIYVIFVSILSAAITHRVINQIIYSKNENIFALSKNLNGINGRMLVTESGRLAYYSDWTVHDSWGLNTPQFSKKLIQPIDIKNGNYDLIVSHCYMDKIKNSIQEKRSWNNQCTNILIAIKEMNYNMYLVPFYTNSGSLLYKFKQLISPPKTNCNRYDIYSINPRSEKYQAIKTVLLQHQAIIYNDTLNFKGGDTLCF